MLYELVMMKHQLHSTLIGLIEKIQKSSLGRVEDTYRRNSPVLGVTTLYLRRRPNFTYWIIRMWWKRPFRGNYSTFDRRFCCCYAAKVADAAGLAGPITNGSLFPHMASALGLLTSRYFIILHTYTFSDYQLKATSLADRLPVDHSPLLHYNQLPGMYLCSLCSKPFKQRKFIFRLISAAIIQGT
jgi:hypothetical protein